ncbi:sugar ABC transporter ATP-binding protein [Salinisphaera sp.]|uniref:sugar ABC transporter ATP-binding protein n=1 Tax=Salinisphaera sp. TaxID=1914330 RepID=UPI002D7667DB|nr:sugar ABC transporter ATP-binding protein [Salinisphaera sp.]HET7313496.1 sugar ABC transporter ATP-binding protein [Salinisphaera sp.]
MTLSANEANAEARTADVVLETRNLSKRYGASVALNDVSLKIRKASIHGLLGENGAGKSTLVGLVSGHKVASSGQIFLQGQPVTGSDVKTMEAAGVFLVTQEPMIVDQFTVAENLLLGIWPRKFGIVSRRRFNKRVREMLADTGLDPGLPGRDLDAVSRRKLNILRALFSGGRVIILDEPTTALDSKDREELFRFMRELKGRDVTFIFISHYNEEILEICDEVSVLRDGRLVDQISEMASLNSAALSTLVLGRDLALFYREPRRSLDSAVPTCVSDVSGGGLAIDEFRIHPGEVVGFVGMPGSGAKTFARALFGLKRIDRGTICFSGQSQSGSLPSHPRLALDRGIAYLSDDRRHDGLVALMSIKNNMTLSSLPAVSRFGVLDRGREQSIIDRYFKSMEIKAESADISIDTLSGGNQQKVCLGRVLATDPRLLILDEPTRGIDVGVKEDVHRLVDELTDDGVSVIVVTSDLDEVVRIVDRVCVFADGRVVEEFAGADMTPEALHAAASGSGAVLATGL